ncbi:MAG TPA: adenylate kinase [Solirubrobacteraceae bacterium]|nr:adenylate kinase [Solirubrobacteraceae bacterium]
MQATITLLGPPGCGKGTQAERLRDRLGFALLSTGDLLREARHAGTELGRRAAGFMDRGELVPDDLIVAMVAGAIGELDDRPVALDGFPRTAEQARDLDLVLRDHSRELNAAVLIDVPDDEVVRRIAGRHQGRTDDTPATSRERLRVYHRETEPLVRLFEARGLLRRVNGAQDADSVEDEVRAALG